jgi:hypothetical protein
VALDGLRGKIEVSGDWTFDRLTALPQKAAKTKRGETEIGQNFVKLGEANLFSKRSVL